MIKEIKNHLDNYEDRVPRLTINSSNLADAVMTLKGDKPQVIIFEACFPEAENTNNQELLN